MIYANVMMVHVALGWVKVLSGIFIPIYIFYLCSGMLFVGYPSVACFIYIAPL